VARSTDGSDPSVARRLLGPSPLPHIEFPFPGSHNHSKQYIAFCCSLQCLCVLSFSVASAGADISCTSESSRDTLLQGKRWWCLKLCDSLFADVSNESFFMTSCWLNCRHTVVPSHVVLSPFSLLSFGLSPNLLYMWWRNKIS
jgi:hypothetical protein